MLKLSLTFAADDIRDYRWTDGSKVTDFCFRHGHIHSGHGLKKCVVLSSSGSCVSVDCSLNNSFVCKMPSQNDTESTTTNTPTTFTLN